MDIFLRSYMFLHRLWRGVKLQSTDLVFEWPQGLDFSRRDLSVLSGANPEYHGYAVTTKSALENMNRIIPFKGKKVLDIGSGKGNVLYHAHKLGAASCHGIEFNNDLNNVACKNLKKLGILGSCVSINLPAQEYSQYHDHDLFFLFNPFEPQLYRKVLTLILQQAGFSGQRFLILYGAHDDSVLAKESKIQLLYSGKCPDRKNEIKIYQF